MTKWDEVTGSDILADLRAGVETIRSDSGEVIPFIASLETCAHLAGIVQHPDETDDEFRARVREELGITEDDKFVPFSRVFGEGL